MRIPPLPGYQQLLVSGFLLVACFAALYIHESIALRYFGVLMEAGIPHGDTFADLRLAYERALAERDPIFNLAGTDPDALRIAAREIEATLDEMAYLAPSKQEAQLIRRLYPIAYLRSLADTEEARTHFISSPTLERSRRYDAVLLAAAHAGRSAIKDFTEAFAEATEGKNESFANMSGIESRVTMLEELAEIAEGLVRSEEAVRARNLCKLTATCKRSSLALPSVAPLPSAPLPRNNEIMHLYAAAGLQQGPSPVPLTLYSGTCMGGPGPHSFIYDANAPSRVPLRYMGDIFFIKTDGSGPVLTYLRERLGMARYPINPYRLYNCPSIGKDISTARAVITFAGSPDEGSVRTTVQSALERTSGEKLSELISLAHMLERGGGGLDIVAGEAAYTLRRLLSHRAAGIGVETGAAYLFLTHSALPSMFQSYNPSFGVQGGVATGSAESFLTRVERYSVIRSSVPREKLIADMRAFFAFETSSR